MKKIVAAILCLLVAASCAACAKDTPVPRPSGYDPSGNQFENSGKLPESEENTAVNEEKPAMLTVEQLLKLTPQNMLGCAEFDIAKFT